MNDKKKMFSWSGPNCSRQKLINAVILLMRGMTIREIIGTGIEDSIVWDAVAIMKECGSEVYKFNLVRKSIR